LIQAVSAAYQKGCLYCGGEVFCAAPKIDSWQHGEKQMGALCQDCAKEFYEVLNRTGFGFEGEASPEQLAKLPRIFAEAEQHMREWVARWRGGGTSSGEQPIS
jgi:hypothetical protein